MTTLFRAQSFSIDKGSLIAGRYEVVDLVGTGGMGVVLRVIDRELNDEVVALKILHSHLAQDKSVFRRFRNEVLVARSLTHPNIIRIHDIGRAEEGRYSYISMEFVDGVSLKERLQTTGDDGEVIRTPLPLDEALSILYQILSGVSYAHSKGVIHRDLKPANVMISKLNEIKLADFGMARILSVENSLTQAGQMLGTPDYMSPEQIRGEVLDAACDIYALGIVAYELVIGRCPFQADSSVALAFKHLSEPIAPFATPENGLPKWFEDAVIKACSKAKEDRYPSVAAFAAELIEHAPQMVQSTGIFSLEGTRHMSSGSLGRAVKSPIGEESKVPVEPGEKKFELGEVKAAGQRQEWSLSGAGDPGAPAISAKSGFGAGKAAVLLLLLAGLGGGGYWYTIIRPNQIAVGQRSSSEDVESLERELMDFNPSGKKNRSDKTPGKAEPVKTEPVKIETDSSTNRPDGDKIDVAKLEPNDGSGSQPEVVSTPVVQPTPSTQVEGPHGADMEVSTAAVTTAPVTTTAATTTETTVSTTTVATTTTVEAATTTVPALTGVMAFKERGAVIADRSLNKERLREITFSGTVGGLPVGDREGREKLISAISVGLVESRSGRLLSRPGFETLPGDSPTSVKVSGGVGASLLSPGEYKLALNYGGKVIASRVFTIEEAAVQTTPSIPTSMASTSVPPPFPPTGGLPPPIRPDTPPGLTPNAESRNLRPEPTAAPDSMSLPVTQHETYSGMFIIQAEGVPDERHAFSMQVDVTGSELTGTATAEGFEPFQVQGQILPRGIELHLNGPALGARLAGGRREDTFKGRFTLSDQRKGSWELRKTN